MRDRAAPTFSREERIALAIAIAAHVALVVALALGARASGPIKPPQRMTVTFSDNVQLKSTSPEPDAQSMPDVAPQRGEVPPEPEPPLPMTRPQPDAKPQPVPPLPRPAPTHAAAPKPRPQSKPAPPKKKDERPRRRPDAPEGGSLIGNDFLQGVPGTNAPGTSKNPPADAIGPAVAASLSSAIARQLKPHWNAPQGVDADKLVTVLAWSMNSDGSLAGRPRVVRQFGITPSNRAQAARHAELAIRAVELAAPFNLPPKYYDAWKRVAEFRFDRKLSQ
ncbi:hypothetical protein RXV95_04060 [Novosphingobium sp. ZN18A2]|uniref:hypothetical protein n=1 Tax=Novosphingobium sp. ZN18A2 TaxID=3079861 RepID=UPI0030D0C7A0